MNLAMPADPAVRRRVEWLLLRAAKFDADAAAVTIPDPDVDWDGWRRARAWADHLGERATNLRWLSECVKAHPETYLPNRKDTNQ